MTVGNTIDVLISELVRSLDPSEPRARIVAPILSERDRSAPRLADLRSRFEEWFGSAHPETFVDDRSRL